MRIGILGGTFDPVHLGHLLIAQEAAHVFLLQEIIFIPSARPPHKRSRDSASAEHRLKMVELATAGNNLFSVSTIELQRAGLSFTIDTVREMRRIKGSDAELFFIVGADSVHEIKTWREPEKILSECHVIAASRPGYPLENLAGMLPEKAEDGTPAVEKVLVMEIPMIGISSSEIRERVSSGRPFRYMVPETVWGYILENKLYLE